MKATKKTRMTTETIVFGALMTAFVIIFQCLGTYTAFFGPFSTAVALIPIVVGAAKCGVKIGGWLGFVFSLVVLLTGGANLFFSFEPIGTVITVIVKGTFCGLAAGVVYNTIKKFNSIIAGIAASIVCPIVNTGIFLLGCITFFMPHADAIAKTLIDAGLIKSMVTGIDLFIVLATGNFIFEIAMNIILNPAIIKLLNIRKS